MADIVGTTGNDTLRGTATTNRMYGLEGNDSLIGEAFADVLDGGTGDDLEYGRDGNDTILGGGGNDKLYGEGGADTLNGGQGTDLLNGGLGNDTYVFAMGDGVDQITDYDTTAGNLDRVSFTGVASTALRGLERQGYDLVVKYGTSDQVTITSYFNASFPGYKVEQFSFSDGVTWDEAAIKARVLTVGTNAAESIYGYSDGPNRMYGLEGNDSLIGEAFADVLDGGTGDDLEYGRDGNDTILGGGGNDKLYGEGGADTLNGGQGTDLLNGGLGNDTYVFAVGDGVDQITDNDTTVGNLDRVSFTGVASTALRGLERQGYDLVVKYGTSDQVTIGNYFSTSFLGYKVEQFSFSDGVIWGEAAIKARVLTVGTSAAESIYGYADGPNRINGLAGNDSLVGAALADVLDGGAGDDLEYGREGNDTILGGGGNDKLYGEGGADTLNGGQGTDLLNGGLGNDTYVFAVGDGVDQITDNDTTVGNLDRVSFTGVASTALRGLERQGYDLVVKYGTSDQVTIGDYFNTSLPGHKVEQFSFSDGVIWDEAAIKARVLTLGTAAGDMITGYSDGTNRMYGLGGNDSLVGAALADVLDGGTGDDSLRGGDGDDTLVGGAGNDLLSGGVGNDSYRFAVGDGADRIVDYDTTLGDRDVVRFTGVASTALRGVERQGKALVVKYGTSDQVTLDDYFHATFPGYQTKQFVFSDGVTWGGTEIKARVITFGTNANDSIAGYTDGANRIYGLDGNDTLTGGAASDLIDGGYGDDGLYGGDGNDTLLAGMGNDSLYGGVGDDLLNGGSDIDLMKGGLGNDRYLVDNVADVITEYTNEGIDLVESSVSYTLSASVENLTLTRTSAINGTGNTLNNVLTGNSANNVLSGLTGNDTYEYSRGGGQDIVVDSAGTADSIRFRGTIDPLDLVLSRQANDLRVAIHGSTDRVTIQNWYGGVTNHTETIQAGAGQTLLSTQVDQLIQAMAAFTQQSGLTWEQAIDQRPQDVQVILAANWQ